MDYAQHSNRHHHHTNNNMGNGRYHNSNRIAMMSPDNNNFQSGGPMEGNSSNFDDPIWSWRCAKTSCPNFASIFCPRCESVAYCCEPHRQDDEMNHKGDCCPETNFTHLRGPVASYGDYGDKMQSSSSSSSSSNSGGFSFVSTNNLNPGDTVCKIQPKMMIPHDKDLPGPSNSSLCLGCCKWFPYNSYKCSKCSWPVCSYNCENNSLHASYECNTFQSCNIPCTFFPGIYDALLTLRCISLFTYDSEFWKAFQSWNVFVDHRQSSSSTTTSTTEQSPLLDDSLKVKFLLKDCRIGSDFHTPDSLRNVLNFVHSNSLCQETKVSVYDVQDVRSYHSAKYVFPYKHVYGQQHCNSTLNWTINFSPNLKEASLHLWATQTLKVGDKLTACFQPTFPEYGTMERRQLMLNNNNNNNRLHNYNGASSIICSCDRCTDPTELNSFASAVKCHECIHGHLLPLDPLVDGSPWECSNKEDCGQQVEAVDIVNKFLQISKDICDVKDDLDGLFRIIRRLKKTDLHPQHYLIAQAANHVVEISWVDVRRRLVTSFKGFDFVPYLKAGQICLNFADKVSPGLTTHRAKYIYFLQMMSGISEVQNALYYHQNSMLVEGRLIRENFDVIHLYQKQCQKILLRKKIGSQEFEWVESLAKSQDDLAELLRVTVRQRAFNTFKLERLQKAFSYFCSEVYQPNLPPELHVDLSPILMEREVRPCRLEYKAFFGF